MSVHTPPAPRRIDRSEVDLLVIGSGTGLATALAARELGLSVAIVEKTEYVGGSTARSGGAFWIPANPVLTRAGSGDSRARGAEYLSHIVGEEVPSERWQAFLDHGPETVRMLERMTPLQFFWISGYSDYHPEHPGGSAAGRSVESRPLNLEILGSDRARLRPAPMAAPLPMPVTGADYKWLNLLARVPVKGVTRALTRVVQGVGGKLIGREYGAGGQALAAGMFAGARRAGIPIWTETQLVSLVRADEAPGSRVTGAVLRQHGADTTVTARLGVVLAAGGFDHDPQLRAELQGTDPGVDLSLGSDGNTGDALKLAQEAGAATALLDQAWWFPAVAPTSDDAAPGILLAERSLPGSLMVDSTGSRFINESTGYMVFGQEVMRRKRAGNPVGTMWLIFDQKYRDRYLFAGTLFPRMPIPQAWIDHGIAHTATDPTELAARIGVSPETFAETLATFNADAAAGIDGAFGRGDSAYDRYYGDPTQHPNPNLRPLGGKRWFAVQIVLSDLGTCGGVVTDARGRVRDVAGETIPGLYAQGNTAANMFGTVYPGAGATIGQGLVAGFIIAQDAAAEKLAGDQTGEAPE